MDGTMFEIVEEKRLKDCWLYSLTEEDMYKYAEIKFSYCEDCDSEEAIENLFDIILHDYGFMTGVDYLEIDGKMKSVYYIIASQEAKESYFKASYDKLKKAVDDLTLKEFSKDTYTPYSISQLAVGTDDDAVYLNGSFHWSFDEFIRGMKVGEKYYFGNTVLMS